MFQQRNIFVELNIRVRTRNYKSGREVSQILENEGRLGNTANVPMQMIDKECMILPHNWQSIISSFYKASFLAHKNGDHWNAFDHMLKSTISFLNFYKECKTNWLNLLAKTLASFLRIFGERSFTFRKRKGVRLPSGSEDELKRSVTLFQRFSLVFNFDDVKKRCTVHFANQMIRLFFKMRNLNSTNQLVKSVESVILGDIGKPAVCPFIKHTKSEQVTWMYYSGVNYMLENNFSKAEQNLSFSFDHCHARSTKNKRKILESLIVVRMVIGKIPTRLLLRKYQLEKRFGELVWAYRQGDLETFDRCLNQHYMTFFHQGTYLILHHARIVVYRNFFKKAVKYYIRIMKEKKMWKARIRFDVLNKILNKLCPSLRQPVEETECVLSNLIYKGYLRGYLSHQKSMLVIKDFKSAFPELKKQHEKI